MTHSTTQDTINRRHLAGFRKIQREIMKAIKDGVPPKEYRAIAAAYREAVEGERAVLGLSASSKGGADWPEEMVVSWVEEDDKEGKGSDDT